MAFKIPLRKLAKALKDSLKKENEKKLWQMYLAVYPYMNVPTGLQSQPALENMSFREFLDFQDRPKDIEPSSEDIKTKYSKMRDTLKVKKGVS